MVFISVLGCGEFASKFEKSAHVTKSAKKNVIIWAPRKARAPLKELLIESQKGLLEMLKPKAAGNENEGNESTQRNEFKNFYAPTRSVRINNSQNNYTNTICNNASLYYVSVEKFFTLHD